MTCGISRRTVSGERKNDFSYPRRNRTRYAEEKKALDAESAANETLERAASESMPNSTGRTAQSFGAHIDDRTADGEEQDGNVAIVAEASQPAAIDMPGAGELAAALRALLRSPPRRATRSAVAKSAVLWTSSNPDRAGGSTAAIVRPTPKASLAMLPPARGECGPRSGKPTVLGPSPS